MPVRSAGALRLGLPATLERSALRIGDGDPVAFSPDACPEARVYVAAFKSNAILIYPQSNTNPAPCGAITNDISGPLGIYIDKKGTLFVANQNNSTVTEYPRNRTSPNVTLSMGVQRPVDTFVGSDETLYVSELSSNKVLEFARGAKSPTRIISIVHPEGVATDNENNLYVSYNGSDGKGHVQKFKPKATSGRDLVSVGFAGDNTLTKTKALVLGDTIHSIINIYPPGKTSPSRSIVTPNNIPFDFALNQAETLLYVAATVQGQVSIYNFKTGLQVGIITNGITYASGVALDPPARLTTNQSTLR